MADYEGRYLHQQFGNYRLVRLLGYGGFAEVYLGEHIHLHTKAAVKILTARLTPKEIEQFRREASTVFDLRHQNIVRVLEYDLHGNIPFIVMEYAAKDSLRDLHPYDSRVPLPTVVEYVKQVAAALQYAHDEGLVHRDVKPQNMLIGKRNEILLSDFGIVTVSSSVNPEQSQAQTGTWTYMAPEQIMKHPVRASDQYALGITVYEWLSGRPPFEGDWYNLYHQHLNVAPQPLHERISDIPTGVEQVVMKALAKEPKERYGSVREFAEALEESRRAKRPLMHNPFATEIPTDLLREKFLNGEIQHETIIGSYTKKIELAGMPLLPFTVKEFRIASDFGGEVRERAIKKFKESMEILQTISHPHIAVYLFSFQREGDYGYTNYGYAKEFIPGDGLLNMLHDSRMLLNEEVVIVCTMQICEALDYLHSHIPSIVVANLDIDEIIVTSQRGARLISVGEAERFHPLSPLRLRDHGRRLRSPYRCAPEYWEKTFDARSDIYLLGAIMYYLLTTQEPEEIPQQGSIYAKNSHLQTRKIGKQVVCPIEQVIIKAMQQDPELRFQNAKAMHTALQLCLPGNHPLR